MTPFEYRQSLRPTPSPIAPIGSTARHLAAAPTIAPRLLPPLAPPHVSIAEAAIFLRISRSSVYELIRRRELRHFKILRRSFVTREACDEYLAARSRS